MLKSQKSKLKKLLHLSDGIKVRLRLFVSMNYSLAIDFLKDSDPILGGLIDRIGACQLNQYELEGDLLCMPISVNSPPTTFHQGG
jgi:hypothetical protein